jgi:2,5-diamino-6-(ribosylamino)-4(3H)-pyrimidinone 5'-phosphate reductase
LPEAAHGKALRLYPLPSEEVDTTAIYSDLPIIHQNEGANHLRPYMYLNMVASVDGQTSLGGKASKIGSDVDRHTMRNLRANSDAVMVGADTLRAERLSLGLDKISRGEQPLGVILTTSGDIVLETNLVFHEEQTILVVSSGAIPEERAEALSQKAKVLRIAATHGGRPDLSKTLQTLKRDYAVERLVVEGGPTLNRALISAELVDEIFLTLAPKLLGSGAAMEPRAMLNGALPATVDLRLLSVHLAADELFLRYAIPRDVGY